MRSIGAGFIAIVILLLPAGQAAADRVVCNNGRVYQGIVFSEDEDTITLDIARYPIRVRIYKGAIKRVQRDTERENSRLSKKIAEAKKMRGFIN